MNSLGDLFSPNRGVVIRTYGERIGVEKCRDIGSYEVRWNRTIETTKGKICYENLPVKIGDDFKFIDLPTRQIHRLGREVSCKSFNHPLFIEDDEKVLWKVEGNKITGNVHLKHKITHSEFKIPPLADMDFNRKHFDDDRAPIDSVLNCRIM